MEQRAAVAHPHPTAASSPPAAPYLQRPGEVDPPDGWIAEPVRGDWHGHRVEVVYDALVHEVAFLWRTRGDRHSPGIDVVYAHHDRDVTLISSDDAASSERTLEALGWTQLAVDGQRSFWTRDRHAATRAALRHLDRTAAGAAPASPTPGARQVDHPKPRGPEVTL